MAGSDQKTQMATELPAEVASALATQTQQPMRTQHAAEGAGARTMIATAPSMPSGPPPMAPPPMAASGGAPPASSAARTMIASAPALPSPSGGGAGGLHQQATVYSMPAPGGGAPSPPATIPPRSNTPPLALHPAAAMFQLGTVVPSPVVTLKWIIGPGIALLMMLLTTFVANRIWPPSTGGGGSAPSFLAAKRTIQLVTDPAGATVLVDGQALDGKTPTPITGDIGTSAQIRVTLSGYDPVDLTLAFTKDQRPGPKIKLVKAGSQQKLIDPSTFDDKPDVTKPDPDTKPEKSPPEDKPVGTEVKTPKTPEGQPDKKGPDAAPEDDGRRKSKRNRDNKEAKDSKEPKDADAKKPATKPTLTVLVRPWAMVYVDGKKVQQTPLRGYALSPGSHKILLVNDSKGKREEIKLKVTADEAIPEIKRTWE